MRNLLALLAALVLAFLLVGGVRGWYGLARQPAASGRVAFRVDFDSDRIGTDLAAAFRTLARRGGEEAATP